MDGTFSTAPLSPVSVIKSIFVGLLGAVLPFIVIWLGLYFLLIWIISGFSKKGNNSSD